MRHPSGDDLAAHALGALEPREERRVTKHATRCERCRAELARLAPAVGALGESVEQHEPPPALRERLMAKVRAEAASAGEPRRAGSGLGRLLLRPAAGLAAVALAGAGVAGYLIADEDGDGSSKIPASSELAGAGASLKVEDDAATLELHGMPVLAKGAVYQVWVAEGPEIRRSATFVPNEDGTATAAVPEVLEGASEVMVTEEPRPGRSTPSLPPLLTVRVD
jgi:anti-sigma-K factor RskA